MNDDTTSEATVVDARGLRCPLPVIRLAEAARDAASGTRLTVLIRCASAEHFEQFLKIGVAKGTAQTLDNLVAFTGRRAA